MRLVLSIPLGAATGTTQLSRPTSVMPAPDRAKHGLTRKGGDHVADQTKARQDEDVNLGVAKKPEQVHIEHRVATTPWVESGTSLPLDWHQPPLHR